MFDPQRHPWTYSADHIREVANIASRADAARLKAHVARETGLDDALVAGAFSEAWQIRHLGRVLSEPRDPCPPSKARESRMVKAILSALSRDAGFTENSREPAEVIARSLARDILRQPAPQADVTSPGPRSIGLPGPDREPDNMSPEDVSAGLRSALADFAGARTDGNWQKLSIAALRAATFIEGLGREAAPEPSDSPAP